MTHSASTTVEGILQLKGRVGFVLSETAGVGDVLIEGPSLRLAMDGDRVRAEVTSPPSAPRRSGRLVAVLVHARQERVGAFGRQNGRAVVWPENESQPILLEAPKDMKAGEGDLVVVRITRWPTLEQPAVGNLVEILGPRSKPGVELKALIHKHGLPDDFPPDVQAEADAYGTDVPPEAYAGRETLFNEEICTIDGADAKDFDDAVSLQHWPQGHPDDPTVRWRLGVHIADVAQYVRESTALDQEAFRRGTSVYLSGSVIPMLPFTLSDGLCSLRPEQVRLTLSCVMDVDAEGRVVRDRVFESAIRSARRFTYEQVDSVLTGNPVGGISPEWQASLLEMGRLAKLLRALRFKRGSLDFDFPEAYVETDPHGRPLDIRKRERLESHRLIEDFMLIANETVARHFQATPFLYRIHETPDPAKLAKLRDMLGVVGLSAPRNLDSGDPAALQSVLHEAEGKPVQAMVHTTVLRSLKQAVYSPTNRGHYGLASKCYTHFTSPIRRFPDLIVHRIIKEHLHRAYRKEHWTSVLAKIATHASQRERIAVTAEREFLDLQRVRFMEKHVGETFDGIITGVTVFGFFVQLKKYFVEGLVHITNLQGDYYIFDELRMTLRGKRTGRSFSMGQSVRVLLAAANTIKRQLDLEWVPGQAGTGELHKARPVTQRQEKRRSPWPNAQKKNHGTQRNKNKKRR